MEYTFGAIEKKKIAVKIDIHAIGLGMSQVDIYLPRYGLHAKQIVFPTPIDGDYVEVRTLTSVKMLEKWGILKKPIANFLSFLTSKGFLKDFLPDIQIWENKVYIENPVYFSNDGPIADYRRWASQFYEHAT